jgi:hypothetical protein
MQLLPIASNQNQLNLNDGTQVFFSYKTPVAAYVPELGYVRTVKKWSTTTSRHINKWLEGINAKEIDQQFLYDLVG